MEHRQCSPTSEWNKVVFLLSGEVSSLRCGELKTVNGRETASDISKAEAARRAAKEVSNSLVSNLFSPACSEFPGQSAFVLSEALLTTSSTSASSFKLEVHPSIRMQGSVANPQRRAKTWRQNCFNCSDTCRCIVQPVSKERKIEKKLRYTVVVR